ncbi:MAG: histidine kinase [Bacillota bacterium]
MNNLDQKIEEVESKIKDIKARWPFHSPKVSMVQELEDLEIELKELKEKKKDQSK